jgi:hypothetical protein
LIVLMSRSSPISGRVGTDDKWITRLCIDGSCQIVFGRNSTSHSVIFKLPSWLSALICGGRLRVRPLHCLISSSLRFDFPQCSKGTYIIEKQESRLRYFRFCKLPSSLGRLRKELQSCSRSSFRFRRFPFFVEGEPSTFGNHEVLNLRVEIVSQSPEADS